MKVKRILLLCSLLIQPLAKAQVAFTCSDQMYVVGSTPSQPSPGLFEVDLTTSPFTFTAISSAGNNLSYNAMGYRQRDHLIYGIAENGVGSTSSNLIQVDATGTTIDLGVVAGLSLDRYIAGDFDNSDRFYVSNSSSSDLYVIDVDSRSVINQLALNTNYRFSDLSYNTRDGMLYAVSTINSLAPEVSGQLIRIDPNTGAVTEVGMNDVNIGIGSLSFVGDGVLYAVDNLNVGVYNIDIITGESMQLSTSPTFSRADSAFCFASQGLIEPVAVTTISWISLILLMALFFAVLGISKNGLR